MLLLISALFLFLYFNSRQIDATLVQKMIAARNAYNYYERTTSSMARCSQKIPSLRKNSYLR
ncbi:MAG: hypothetical protein U1F27_01230 [Turneriella sp.]